MTVVLGEWCKDLGMTGEKIGLVVITLERYFKIVHAIAHRNHYRNWMTSMEYQLYRRPRDSATG